MFLSLAVCSWELLSSYKYYSVNSGFSCKYSVNAYLLFKEYIFFAKCCKLMLQKNGILSHSNLEPSRLVFFYFVRSLF